MIGVKAYELPTRGGEMAASQIGGQNQQQQQQPANTVLTIQTQRVASHSLLSLC